MRRGVPAPRPYHRTMKFPQPSTIFLAIFLAIVAALGVWRTHREPIGPHVERIGTGSVVLSGRIADLPEIGDTSIAYELEDLAIVDGSGAFTAIGGSVLLRDRAMWPRHAYGERVRATGTLQIAEHEGYGKSLRAQGIQATMFVRFIDTDIPAPLSAFGILGIVRESVEGRIRQLLPEPEASLAVGLLTGTRASFPPTLTEALRTSGLTHIVAVSGSNVAIVLVLLEQLFFWVPRRWRLTPLLGGLVLFALFTGASASVVRACIMGGLGVLALHAGRLSQARRAVVLTAGVMLLWNPRLLTGDLGFQLSFLSVIGIMEVSPLLEPLLKRVPNVLALREGIALTLASQVTAAPWIAYTLGNVSLVALPANLLAAPLIPLSMLLGAATLLLSPLGLGLLAAFVAKIPLTLIIAVAHGTAAVPFAAVDGLRIPLPMLIAYYVCLAGILWHYQKPRPNEEAGSAVVSQALRIIAPTDRRPAP